jgi:hypothetical protein
MWVETQVKMTELTIILKVVALDGLGIRLVRLGLAAFMLKTGIPSVSGAHALLALAEVHPQPPRRFQRLSSLPRAYSQTPSSTKTLQTMMSLWGQTASSISRALTAFFAWSTDSTFCRPRQLRDDRALSADAAIWR